MSTHTIARRYAKALVHVAGEQGKVEQFYEEVLNFSNAIGCCSDVNVMLADPGIRIEAKQEIVKMLSSKLELCETINNFLLLLLEKKRLDELGAILESYRSFADEAAGILRSTVTSAMPLSENQVNALKGSLERATGKKIVLSVATDSSLIAGVVTKIGDKVLDGSVKAQLAKIHDILQKG